MQNFALFLQPWGRTLWLLSSEVIVLALVVGTVSLCFRRMPAVFHYWLWSIVLVRLCIPVAPLFPSMGTFIGIPTVNVFSGVADPVVLNAAAVTASGFTISPIMAWAAVVSVMLLLILRRALRINKLLCQSRPVERNDLLQTFNQLCRRMQIRKQVELHQITTSAGVGPAVIGLRQPVIYLPDTLAKEWTVQELEPVLLHELAHIQRWDLLVNWLQIAVQVCYCFHPMVWFVNWKIRRLREDVCDDIAVDSNAAGRTTYPASMLRVVQETGGVTMVNSWAMGFTETGKSLAGRITRICSAKYNGATRLSVRAMLGIGAIALGSLIIAQCSTSEDILSNTAHNATTQEILPLEEQPKLLGGSLGQQLKELLVYPEAARKAGIQGQVIVKTLIGTDGTVQDTKLHTSVPGSGFDEAAIAAITQLKFKPAQKDGTPVEYWFTIPIRFSLSSSKSTIPGLEEPKVLGGTLDEQMNKYLVWSGPVPPREYDTQVDIKILIGTDGTVQDTEILEEINPEIGYGEAIAKAAKQLTFSPAKMNGTPVDYWYTIPLTFAAKSGYKKLMKNE
jgi:TonB family protein